MQRKRQLTTYLKASLSLIDLNFLSFSLTWFLFASEITISAGALTRGDGVTLVETLRYVMSSRCLLWAFLRRRKDGGALCVNEDEPYELPCLCSWLKAKERECRPYLSYPPHPPHDH